MKTSFYSINNTKLSIGRKLSDQYDAEYNRVKPPSSDESSLEVAEKC